jgi:uncharacterized membrane protein
MNDSLVNRWRAITLTSVLILIAIVVCWQLWPQPTLKGAVQSIVLSLPLILPLAGLWKNNRYTYRWATLCVLPYFVVGLTETIANPETRGWTSAMLVFALTWFVSLVAFLRVSATNPTLGAR